MARHTTIILATILLLATATGAAQAAAPVSGRAFVAAYYRAGMACWDMGNATQGVYDAWLRGQESDATVIDQAERLSRACNYFLWDEDLPIPKGSTQKKLFSAWHDAGEMWIEYAVGVYDDATNQFGSYVASDALSDRASIVTRIDYYESVLNKGGSSTPGTSGGESKSR